MDGPNKKCGYRFKNKVSSRNIPRYFFRIYDVSPGKLLCLAFICRNDSGTQPFGCDSDRNHVFCNFTCTQVHNKALVRKNEKLWIYRKLKQKFGGMVSVLS